jgi:hypothetical protein
MRIKLGDKVTDCVTGFTGTAWSRTTYLAGEDMIGVLPRTDDGKYPTCEYFAEDRLIATKITELAALKEGDVLLIEG